jgi:hypothetical protein
LLEFHGERLFKGTAENRIVRFVGYLRQDDRVAICGDWRAFRKEVGCGQDGYTREDRGEWFTRDSRAVPKPLEV